LTCSFYEDILYFIKGCVYRTFNKNLATKHYFQIIFQLGAGVKNNTKCWSFSYSIWSFPTVFLNYSTNPTVFFCRVCCIPYIYIVENRDILWSFLSLRNVHFFGISMAKQVQIDIWMYFLNLSYFLIWVDACSQITNKFCGITHSAIKNSN
jgi:hypothetical protein